MKIVRHHWIRNQNQLIVFFSFFRRMDEVYLADFLAIQVYIAIEQSNAPSGNYRLVIKANQLMSLPVTLMLPTLSSN